MAICIHQDIAEHRAELAHSLLTKRERAETLRRLEKLLAEVAAKEAEA